MIPVLVPTVCLLAGVVIGLRVKHRRFLAERQRRRECEARLDGYDRNAFATDLDLVGPVTGPSNVVPLFDQDTDPLAFAASVGREHAAVRPPAMTGVRDTDAQDRELVDTYGICPEAGGCRRETECAESGCYWRRLDTLNRPLIGGQDT